MKVLGQEFGESFVAYHGDSCEVLQGLDDESVGYSVYSPPFSSIYQYDSSPRDMSNCSTDEQFFEHYSFLLEQLFRVTKSGRNMSAHCMDLCTSKARDGYIGLRDFPGDIIRAAQRVGWIWHAKVTIRKDPVTAMQRTKALGLLHKQIKKDSCMSRMGIPDYVLTFRKPGENASPVQHTNETFPVSRWQQWAEPIWTISDSAEDIRLLEAWAGLVWEDINPSDTLQFRAARDEDDSKHICPLQLEVIRRCIHMWSNPGDIVLTPFGGIGSEGYVAVKEGRRAVLVELKDSYFKVLAGHMREAERLVRQPSLFSLIESADKPIFIEGRPEDTNGLVRLPPGTLEEMAELFPRSDEVTR